jgi:hypothetical protein
MMARMKHFRFSRRLGVAVIALMLNLTLSAQSSDSDAIQKRLSTQFKLTTITADRTDIVTPGSVVQLHRDGLEMYSVGAPGAASNTYKNGRISMGGAGFAKGILIASMSPGGLAGGGYPSRKFVEGENCWVTAITVQKDGVQFKLYSDPYSDLRYYANLKIPFPEKNQIPTADQMLAIVAEVLTVAPEPAQTESASTLAVPQPASAPTTNSYQTIAAPPPLPAPVPTISIGMTKDQVTAGLGDPARKAVAGVKEIFFYSDLKLKITFTNGIVSDID